MKQQFFNLLAYSNELKKNKKYLSKEDPEKFAILLHFLAIIETNLHYLEKTEYCELAKDFLLDQITADNFSSYFMAIYQGINRKLRQMEKNESLELVNFLEPNRSELGSLLARIYGTCDSFSPDPEIDIATSTQEDLKECAQSLLLELEEK